jgi:hypothetical protein
MASNAEKRSALPVEYYLSTTDSHELGDEKFGLSFESVSADSSTSASSTLHVDCCTYEEMYALITDTPQCHKRQETQILADSDCDDDPDDRDQQYLLTSPDIIDDSLCTIALKHILIKVLTWYFAHKAVARMSNTACFNIHCLPFIVNMTGNLFGQLSSDEELSSDLEEHNYMHDKRLNDLLLSWKLKRCVSDPTGNCVFNAVTHNLKFQLDHGNVALHHVFESAGITAEPTISEIMTTLKRLVADQWLGDNSEAYQEFLTSAQLHDQAAMLLQSGTFSSDIEDLAKTALSNCLKMLFTSAEKMPLLMQLPTYCDMVTPNPVLVAYAQKKPAGCFVAVTPDIDSDSQGQESTAPSAPELTVPFPSKGCTCGRKATKGSPCSYSAHQYSCRCPCFNSKQACDIQCNCKACSNPFGMKLESQGRTIGQKRKRISHQHQSVPLRGKRTATFMKEVGEPATIGGFSVTEFLTLCAIVHNELSEAHGHCDWDQAPGIDIFKIHSTYTAIIELVQSMGITLSMYPRTSQEVKKLLKLFIFKKELTFQRFM